MIDLSRITAYRCILSNQKTNETKSKPILQFSEKQDIHSTDPSAEFYIIIYGSITQSASGNISATKQNRENAKSRIDIQRTEQCHVYRRF